MTYFCSWLTLILWLTLSYPPPPPSSKIFSSLVAISPRGRAISNLSELPPTYLCKLPTSMLTQSWTLMWAFGSLWSLDIKSIYICLRLKLFLEYTYNCFNKGFFGHLEFSIGKLLFGGHSRKSLHCSICPMFNYQWPITKATVFDLAVYILLRLKKNAFLEIIIIVIIFYFFYYNY